MRNTVVIDDIGEAWPLGAPRLRQLAEGAATDADIAAYAVRNLGFALLRPQGRLAYAQLCPALVKPPTLIGVYYTLLDWKPAHILLSRATVAGGAHELFDDLAEFAATLERDVDDAGLRLHRDAFALTPRTWQELHRPRYARFAPAVALWGATRGRLPADLVPFLCRYGLQGRSMLTRNPPGTDRLVFEHAGSGLSFVTSACLPLQMVGRDMEALPDPHFGECVARSYHACAVDLAPRVETVNAVLRREDGRRVWSYYDRILLPLRAADGTRYVLGISEVRRRMLAV